MTNIATPVADCNQTNITNLRLALYKNGYQPVPVLGAYTGVKNAGKAPKMPGWQTKCIDADESAIEKWTKSQPQSVNTGLLCGWKIVGVDIDMLDEILSKKLEACAVEMLGATPLRRVGRAPKVLLVYRVDSPHNKISTPALILNGDVNDKGCRVEILATGQHFVADGIHPDTLKPYVWTDHSPFDIPVADLPFVTFENLAKFVAESEKIIRAAGGQTRREIEDGVKTRKAEEKNTKAQHKQAANNAKDKDKAADQTADREREGRSAAGIRLHEKPTREKIEDALNHIPNNLDYDEWIDIGFALYDGLRASGQDLWEKFSAQYKGDDPRVSAAKWPSFANGSSITIGTLFWHAKQHGWRWLKKRRPASGANHTTRDANQVIPNEELPEIEVKDGHLSELADEAEELLIAAGVPLYQRGGELVRPIIETVDASHGRRTKVAQLRVLDPVYLRDLLARHASWVKYDKREEQLNLTNPPYETATTILARAGEWGFKTITGVISTPTMRPDGSLLTAQGYDEATGLLLVEPPAMPMIPDKPTKAQAQAALMLIEDLLVGFPFVESVSKSVALSAIMTPVLRGAFPVTPMHASRAPAAGSGKSFLWDIVAAIAVGQRMPVMSTGANVDETEKRLGAAMMAGQPLISIDNISGELGGDALCQIIERPLVELRILGRSERVRIEARGTSTFSTGNNFVVVGDLCRRLITVNLDPETERPELRQFKFDPVERVLADRGNYIAAILTIGRAYFAAGRPGLAPKLASFEGWSDTVRSALIWLGKADPCESMEAARDEDPERAELREWLEAWSREIGLGYDNRFRLGDVIIKGTATVQAGQRFDMDTPAATEPTLPLLYAVLEALAYRSSGRRGQKPDARLLGNYLRRFKGRVINGRRFAVKADEKRGAEWYVEEVSSERAQAAA
jgi:putative DNA primase/helicase